MPAVTCAEEMNLSQYDVENCRDNDGNITRDSIEEWLTSHAGNFQSVQDFRASIEDGENTVEIDFQSEESEITFADCFYPEEVEA